MRTDRNAHLINAFNAYLQQLAPEGEKIIRDVDDIAYTLNKLGQKTFECNAHWGVYAHMVIENVTTYQDGLRMKLGQHLLVKAKELEIYNFKQKPDLGFMRLSFDAWKETCLYDSLDGIMHEEYVRVNGDVLDRNVWDNPTCPLPTSAHLESRLVKPGHMIIVSKGSDFNGSEIQDRMESLKQLGKNSPVFADICKQRQYLN